MRAIAQRALAGMLATAKEQLLIPLGRNTNWLKICTLMGPIAKGLILTAATGAPGIGLARLNINGVGAKLGNMWGDCHGVSGWRE